LRKSIFLCILLRCSGSYPFLLDLNFIKFPWFNYVSCLLISDYVCKSVRSCCYHFPQILGIHDYNLIPIHFLDFIFSFIFTFFVLDRFCFRYRFHLWFSCFSFPVAIAFWSRIYVLAFSEFLGFSRIKFVSDLFSCFLFYDSFDFFKSVTVLATLITIMSFIAISLSLFSPHLRFCNSIYILIFLVIFFIPNSMVLKPFWCGLASDSFVCGASTDWRVCFCIIVTTSFLLNVFIGKQHIVEFNLKVMVIANNVVDWMHSSVLVWLLLPLARMHIAVLVLDRWWSVGQAPTLRWIYFELLLTIAWCCWLLRTFLCAMLILQFLMTG